MMPWTLFTIALSFTVMQVDAKPNLRPRWAMRPVSFQRPNTSYLADYSRRTQPSAFDQVIDPHAANAIRNEYEAVTRAHELKQAQGLSDQNAERGFIDHISGMAKGIYGKIRDFQRNRSRDKAVDLARKYQRESQSTPVLVVGTLLAAVSDTPIEVRLDESTYFVARANVEKAVGSVILTSSLFNGNFEFTPRAEERYKLSLLRTVPLTDMTSSLSYKRTSNVVTASVHKPITNTLAAVVDSSKPLVPGSSWNESIRFVYDIKF